MTVESNLPPPWVSWQDYVDGHLDLLRRELLTGLAAMRAQLKERHEAQLRATQEFSAVNERSLEKVNEFRASMDDRTRQFASIDSLNGVIGKLDLLAQENDRRFARFEADLAAHTARDEQSHANNRIVILWIGVILMVVQIAARYLWR